jgi:hypothetical protein
MEDESIVAAVAFSVVVNPEILWPFVGDCGAGAVTFGIEGSVVTLGVGAAGCDDEPQPIAPPEVSTATIIRAPRVERIFVSVVIVSVVIMFFM